MNRRVLSILLSLTLLIGLFPISALAAGEYQHDISDGDVTISGDSCGCSAENPHVITGTAKYHIPEGISYIDISSGTHYVKLSDVTVEQGARTVPGLEIDSGADVTLILEGTSTLSGGTGNAGVYVAEDAQLTIQGDGTLYANGGTSAAGIGGSNGNTHCGHITIESGWIYAQGGSLLGTGAAGIGSGYATGGSCAGSITINGGYVNAKGGSDSAGIGGGENVGGCAVTINGGVVYAQGDNSPSIGGGSKDVGTSTDNGTFSTGTAGNAVIVAPQGLGNPGDPADLSGIFVSSMGSEGTAVLSPDGTVVLNDSSANIQVWGQPVLDHSLSVEAGTNLRVVANDRNGQSASLTMESGTVLTNNGTITLGAGNGDASYLILKGGTASTTGSGKLTVSAPAAVKLPLEEKLVSVTPSSPSYTGQAQPPAVTVSLELWGYEQGFAQGTDYTQAITPAGEIKNAGSYTITLESTGTGNLLAGQPYTYPYVIAPADLTVYMPSQWTVWKDQAKVSSLPSAPSRLSSVSAPTAIAEVEGGTLTWYSDAGCTTELRDDDPVFTSGGTVYWKYTHNQANFQDGLTGSMSVIISSVQPPTVGITGDNEKTYGDPDFTLSLSLTREGTPVTLSSAVSWESSDPEVATVTGTGANPTVTITGSGDVTITASVAAYQGTGADGYPAVSGTFHLHVDPKEISVDDSALTLNGAVHQSSPGSADYTWAYDGKTSIPADGAALVAGELVGSDGADLTLNASAVVADPNVTGADTTATVTYTLTGSRAKHYTLKSARDTKTVRITQAAALTPNAGSLTITNELKKTYFFNLSALLPVLTGTQSLGSVQYGQPQVDIQSGNAYTGQITAQLFTGSILKVDVEAVDEQPGKIGEIRIPITVQNYAAMTAVIELVAEDTPGDHSYGDITIRNQLAGNAASTSDSFTYTIVLESVPLSGGQAAAFTAPVAYRGTGTVVGGSNGIVSPDADGTIRFTLRGGEYLTFSGNLNQDHKIDYTITQQALSGYSVSTVKTLEDGSTQTGTALTVTGYLHCQHSNPSSGIITNEWAEIVYTNTKNVPVSSIVYRPNGAGGSDQTDSYPEGSQATISANPFSRPGYSFTGWNTAADGSGTSYQPGAAFTVPSGGLILYAQWRYTGGASIYTLRYETNGGNLITAESKSSSWTKSYQELPVPVREGYVFAGWYTDSNLHSAVTGDVQVNRSTVTLYAKWVEDPTDPDNNGVSNWLNTKDHNAYLHGFGSGAFGPDNNMTRGQVAQMFYNLLLEKEVPVTVSFRDVDDDLWCADAVNTLASLGILKGYSDGTFRPNQPITRAQFTVIAMRFADLETGGENCFSDVSADDWFYAEVVGSIQYGWIQGYADGTFRPYQPITRAQVTTIVNRMLGRSADTDYVAAHQAELTQFPDVPASYWAYASIMEAANGHSYVKTNGSESWTGLKQTSASR
jgi:uncharacterized repeat protein (TIGR02543 family)